jgi:hypothetical protein
MIPETETETEIDNRLQIARAPRRGQSKSHGRVISADGNHHREHFMKANPAITPAPISIETRVAAHPGKVWHHWVTPREIEQWNGATEEWHCPRPCITPTCACVPPLPPTLRLAPFLRALRIPLHRGAVVWSGSLSCPCAHPGVVGGVIPRALP